MRHDFQFWRYAAEGTEKTENNKHFYYLFHFGVEHILSWKILFVQNMELSRALSLSIFTILSLVVQHCISCHTCHTRCASNRKVFFATFSCFSFTWCLFSSIWYACGGLTKLIYCKTFSGALITSRHSHSMMMMMKLIFSYLRERLFSDHYKLSKMS